jgi:hypothetical protein
VDADTVADTSVAGVSWSPGLAPCNTTEFPAALARGMTREAPVIAPVVSYTRSDALMALFSRKLFCSSITAFCSSENRAYLYTCWYSLMFDCAFRFLPVVKAQQATCCFVDVNLG